MIRVNTYEIVLRLLAAVFVAGIIGVDREHHNHPAGIRTHILVCVGACIIALIQQAISVEAINAAVAMPRFSGVIRADPARLVAQVVSGVGFLGAGTIVITRHSITGLTTAASLWATAGLGIAIGMGYYRIAFIGAVVVLLTLVILKKVLRIHTLKKIEIKFTDKKMTTDLLNAYFKNHHVKISNCSFTAEKQGDGVVYKNIYVVDLPRNLSYPKLMSDLSIHDTIETIRLINI